MEIPNLVRERLGGESIEATVNLGDEDVICVTPTRSILYRGEGLLSDESVEVYSHDVERVDLSEGRRNTKFVLHYVDGTEEFKIPGSRADSLLKILLQGMLRVAGVADDEESVAGVFQFSELTLVVTDSRLIKHVGASVWDEDFEVFDYDDVTALEFEEGSVATQIVLTVDGRPQRIKAPNDKAGKVEQTLTQTLCAYYDVDSLEQLAAHLDEGESDAEERGGTDVGTSSDIELDDGISPLVGGDESDTDDDAADRTGTVAGDLTGSEASSPGASDAPATTSTRGSADSPGASENDTASLAGRSSDSEQTGEASTGSQSGAETSTGDPAPSVSLPEDVATAEDVEAIEEQLSVLTDAVKRQNKLLRRHNERIDENDEKIDTLIEELRRGR